MLKEIALLSPIYVSLFWSLVFFVQGNKIDKSKVILGILMILAFLLYCSHAIFFNNFYKLYSYIESIYLFSMLSMYPMYYLYLLSISKSKIVFKRQLSYFVPALVFSVTALIMTIILTPAEREIYVKEALVFKNFKELNLSTLIGIKGLIFFLSRAVLIVQVIYFLIKGVFVANKHNEQIANYYSNTEGKTLNWAKSLNIVFLFISVSSITFAFIGRSYFFEHEVSLLIPSGIFSIFLFTIGFYGNLQVQLNSEFKDEEFGAGSNEIKNGQNELLKNKLVRLFTEVEVFKNSDLRITSVSESLKTNRTYISKLINDEFQMNFNEFVNKYRIKESKKLLRDENKDLYTMEYIAEKAGFGSVNSFTRVFKAIVGMPPGRYRGAKNGTGIKFNI